MHAEMLFPDTILSNMCFVGIEKQKDYLYREKTSRKNISKHRPQNYPLKIACFAVKESSQILVCSNTVTTLISSAAASSEQLLVLLLI